MDLVHNYRFREARNHCLRELDFDALPIMEDTGLDFASQNKGLWRLRSLYQVYYICLP